MFMKKKFILGVIYVTAATAQGQQAGSAYGDYTLHAIESVTDAVVDGASAGVSGFEQLEVPADTPPLMVRSRDQWL
jgi:hypothetical protein